jgi:DNA-binding transcriptional regulator GbsR (MarR family)
MSPRPADVTVENAVLRVADTIGALMESWGFKRNMGRMWGLLYLERRPMSAQEIGERLTLSSGAVSTLIAELTQWSAVRRIWIPGERREYFEAETNIWKLVSRVFRERELRWINSSIETFAGALTDLRSVTPDDRQHQLAERIESLLALARIGAHLLTAILDGESIDVLPLKAMDELARTTWRAAGP